MQEDWFENNGNFMTFISSKFPKFVNFSFIFIFCNFPVIRGNMNLFWINSISFKVPMINFQVLPASGSI